MDGRLGCPDFAESATSPFQHCTTTGDCGDPIGVRSPLFRQSAQPLFNALQLLSVCLIALVGQFEISLGCLDRDL
jgi:hypothetical protein